MADYADTLVKALRHSARPGITIQDNASTADCHISHLGNNRLHADIYTRAIGKPGIVVIHDAVLHHFLLGALSEAEYVEEFVYNYGEWNRHVGEDLWRDRAACSVDPRYFQYPMLRRAVEQAKAVIVHNPGAATIATAHGARNVRIIPHFFEQSHPPDAFETTRFREALGVKPGTTLFGIFGYLRETKRLLPCMRAFRRLHEVRPETALLIAGEAVSGDLNRLLSSEPPHPAIHRMGYLSDSQLGIASAAVDCGVNLRFPAAGETSGIAIHLMGIAKPVILTEGPETADIPDAACLRVPAGHEEGEVLFRQMAFVTEFPALGRRIGEAAAAHIERHHSLANAVEGYLQVIDSIVVEPR